MSPPRVSSIPSHGVRMLVLLLLGAPLFGVTVIAQLHTAEQLERYLAGMAAYAIVVYVLYAAEVGEDASFRVFGFASGLALTVVVLGGVYDFAIRHVVDSVPSEAPYRATSGVILLRQFMSALVSLPFGLLASACLTGLVQSKHHGTREHPRSRVAEAVQSAAFGFSRVVARTVELVPLWREDMSGLIDTRLVESDASLQTPRLERLYDSLERIVWSLLVASLESLPVTEDARGAKPEK